MQDRVLYEENLGLKSPWSVSQVTPDLEQQQVDVFLEHPSGTKSVVLSVQRHCLAVIIPLSGSGGTVTVASSRLCCTPVFRDSIVLSME
jgi:hypothetical protein